MNRPRSVHVEPADLESSADLEWVQRLKTERRAELARIAADAEVQNHLARLNHWHALRCRYQQEPFVNDPLQLLAFADLPQSPPAGFHRDKESWHVPVKIPGHDSVYTVWEFRPNLGWIIHRRSYGDPPTGEPEWWIQGPKGLIPYRHLADALNAVEE